MNDNGNNSHKPWAGRFTEATDAFVERFTASVNFDHRLYPYDIEGSKAHAAMLAAVGVLTQKECQQIQDGLGQILEEIEAGKFLWRQEFEDVHMNIELRLTELIGEVGKKLHTGRSRNDQVATDLRLYLRSEIDDLSGLCTQLMGALLDLAEHHVETIMPGFTHLQTAQPVTFGHHLMAWFEMLKRDYGRLLDCRARVDVMPLGSAALAGTTFPIDRELTAAALGFARISENSLDAVSDRDFVIEFCAFASLAMNHFSRWSEELVLWSSQRFQFINLPDRFCTGSSIMPQKKNPDVPELIRGKSGRVTGHLVGLLMLMKGQPLAYNKDNQEDKEPLFDAVDTLRDVLTALIGMVPNIEANATAMADAARQGFATATDLADYLVRRGLPFRDAHAVVGQAVAYAIKKSVDLSQLTLEELNRFSPIIEQNVYDVLTLEGSVAARDHLGGTAPNSVRAAIQRARDQLPPAAAGAN